MRNRGRLADAEKLLTNALTIAGKEPIRDVNLWAEVRGNWGVLRGEQKQLAVAKEALSQALTDRIKAIGEKNPIVAADRCKLARVLIELKEWDGVQGAEALLAMSEEELLRVFGEGHLRTAKCFEAIAELRLAQMRNDDAAAYAVRVLATREKVWVAPHPEIILALELLGALNPPAATLSLPTRIRPALAK